MKVDLEPKIALFIDYDNIAIGLREAGSQNFDAKKIIERLLEKGRIIYKRAYADWSLFLSGKQSMHEAGIELVDIPVRRSIGKNSADIRLVVDALDLCYTKEHIDTFVIGSGDSDFSPLVSKLKENDKHVIGFGLRGSTSHILADSCDEFIFYEELVDVPVSRPPLPPGLTKNQFDAFSLLLDAVGALMRENKDVLWGSLVKETIRRKRPSFNEGQYGYSLFSHLLEDAARFKLIGLIKDSKSGGTPVITGYGSYNGSYDSDSKSDSLTTPVGSHPSSLVVHRDSKPRSVSTDERDVKPRAKSPAKSSLVTRKRVASTKKETTVKVSSAADKKVDKVDKEKETKAPVKKTSAKTVKKTAAKPKTGTTARKTTRKTAVKKPVEEVAKIDDMFESQTSALAIPDSETLESEKKETPALSSIETSTDIPAEPSVSTEGIKSGETKTVKEDAKDGIIKESPSTDKKEDSPKPSLRKSSKRVRKR